MAIPVQIPPIEIMVEQIARPIRGCATDEQYADVVERAKTALYLAISASEDELKRLWHFAGCPYDHCQKCIDDTEWIKSLESRLGPPSAKSVQILHDTK